MPEMKNIKIEGKEEEQEELARIIKKVLQKFPEFIKEKLEKFPIVFFVRERTKGLLKPEGKLVDANGVAQFNEKKRQFEIIIRRACLLYFEEEVKERLVAHELLHVYVAQDNWESGISLDVTGLDEFDVRELLQEYGFKIPDEEIRAYISEYIEAGITSKKELLKAMKIEGFLDEERVRRLINEELENRLELKEKSIEVLVKEAKHLLKDLEERKNRKNEKIKRIDF
jgi:hypothetical protein